MPPKPRRPAATSALSTAWTATEIGDLARLRILVVGDLILDRYIWGRADRISPEAPVLVAEFLSEHVLLGGAGNVVNNLRAAGARVDVCGVVGDDANGRYIADMLAAKGVADLKGVVVDPSRPTIEKTRVLAGAQQILRIDREKRHDLDPRVEKKIATWLARRIGQCDGVILSDYLKGLLTPGLIHHIATLAREKGRQVTADPKGADYGRYRGVDWMTPNQKEAQAATGETIHDRASLTRAGRRLVRITGGRGAVITRGHEDTALFQKGRKEPTLVPVHPREVFDVTGAGDTFISYFSLALFAGHRPEKAVALGNLAGGLAVEKIGAVAVSPQDLLRQPDTER